MITVIGTGPGGREHLTPEAVFQANKCAAVFGTERQLELFEEISAEKSVIKHINQELAEKLKMHEGIEVGLLATGDPGLFGILGWLKKHFSEDEIRVVPGISSAQLFFSRIALPWQEVFFASVHGRELKELEPQLKGNDKICLFTDSASPPERIALKLREMNWQGMAILGERIGMKDERITRVVLEELAAMTTLHPALLYLEKAR